MHVVNRTEIPGVGSGTSRRDNQRQQCCLSLQSIFRSSECFFSALVSDRQHVPDFTSLSRKVSVVQTALIEPFLRHFIFVAP